MYRWIRRNAFDRTEQNRIVKRGEEREEEEKGIKKKEGKATRAKRVICEAASRRYLGDVIFSLKSRNFYFQAGISDIFGK